MSKCISCDAPYDQYTQHQGVAISRVPLVIGCGHTYCSACINTKYMTQRYFYCYLCKKNIVFDAIVKAPVNFALYDVLDQMKNMKNAYQWQNAHRFKNTLSTQQKLLLRKQDKCFNEDCFKLRYSYEDGSRQMFCSEQCLVDFQNNEDFKELNT